MGKLIGNAVIVVAGGFLFAGGLIAVGIVLLYATSVVLVRRLGGGRPPAPPRGLFPAEVDREVARERDLWLPPSKMRKPISLEKVEAAWHKRPAR